MKKTLVLHIGHYKTGTTALQVFCGQNDRALARMGLSYAHTRRNFSKHSGYAYSLLKAGGASTLLHGFANPQPPEALWARLFAEVRATAAPMTMISSEEFLRFGAYPEAGARLAAILASAPDIEVRAIAYLRPVHSHLRSWHNQLIKMGVCEAGFTESVLTRIEPVHYDYALALGPWAEMLGPRRLTIRAYDDGLRKGDRLYADFLGALGLAMPPWPALPAGDPNPRLDEALLDAARLENAAKLHGPPPPWNRATAAADFARIRDRAEAGLHAAARLAGPGFPLARFLDALPELPGPAEQAHDAAIDAQIQAQRQGLPARRRQPPRAAPPAQGKPLRILYVNWVDYRDPARRGGGVSVYQRNLIAALERRGGIEASFLAAGTAHGLRGRAPRVVALPAAEGERARRFQLVNSGTLSPAHADFGNPAQIDHPATVAALAEFLQRTGPYDVIHYNNLEGVPAAALRLAAGWPGTTQVLSLHNYFPFCPQVNLWHQETAACTDFRGGAACVNCLPHRGDRRVIRTAYAVEWRAQLLGMGPGTAGFDRVIHPSIRLGWRGLRRLARLRRGRAPAPQDPEAAVAPAPPDPAEARAFAHRRAEMVALINTHCQQVLCVSDRVRQIALGFGIDPGLARTCYIGSAEAEAWQRTAPRPAFLAPDGTLRLAYLGYMRRDKGFPFLMAALAALPPELAARLHLTVAARAGEAQEMAALAALRPRLAGLTHRDGYAHAELDDLLSGVDLGLVPVMWEDNLPQVAIEMHARHIPLLCSDRGGAQELGRCPELVFRAGDAADFARALSGVLDGRVTPADYWRNAMPPVDPDRHLAELLEVYEAARAAANTRSTSGQARQGTETAAS